MALGAATIAVLPLHDTTGLSRAHAFYWPEPQLVTEPDPDEGPVLITVTFTVPEANVVPFLEAMTHVRASRQRTGAARWSLYRDAADPSRFVEAYHVPSWDEHLRQHRDRLTGADQDLEAQALKLTDRTAPGRAPVPGPRAGLTSDDARRHFPPSSSAGSVKGRPCASATGSVDQLPAEGAQPAGQRRIDRGRAGDAVVARR